MPVFQKYLSLVKFSHTVFALPFALTGFFLGYQQTETFSLKVFLLVLLCMVFARNAAMAFNRLVDAQWDKQNERTKNREVPAGILSKNNVLLFTVFNSLFFIGTCWFINSTCFFLSPVALMVILGYSLTKRFTAICHLILGLGLSLAPVGAYLAVTGAFALPPILLGIAVLLWVSGFDIIYALQDRAFDLKMNLKSIPVLLGMKGALSLSRILHLFCFITLLFFGFLIDTAPIFWIGVSLFGGFLIYQQSVVKPEDLSKINLAFFTANGIASVVFGAITILSILFRN